MNNPIVWFEIYVSDIDRSKRFYQTLIGSDLIPMSNSEIEKNNMKMLGFPSNDKSYGCSGAIVEMEGMPLGSHSAIPYFMSDDCEKLAQKMQEMGGVQVKAKTDIGEHGFFCLIKDPDANIIGIHSMN